MQSRRNSFSLKLAIAASLLLIAALGFAFWKFGFSQAGTAKGLRALHSAYRKHRPLESRISSFDYAPFSTTDPSRSEVDEAELHRAERILLETRDKEPATEVQHARGQLYLAKKQFEDAIREFAEALGSDPKNPVLLSDLGAAWLEKGKTHLNKGDDQDRGDVEAWGQSLSYFNQALEQDDNLLDARFNRALCFQYLHLLTRAEEEWREYLNRDATSSWAHEAQQALREEHQHRSDKTKDQLLSDFATAYAAGDEEKAWQLISVTRDDLSGTSISQQLLDSYLELFLAGKTDAAARQLQALTYVGELERKRTNEHYTFDLAAMCRSLTPKQKATVVKARNLMKSGYKMYEQSANTTSMLNVFAQAAQTFADANDRAEMNHARFWLAYCSLDGLNTQQGLALLSDLASNCTKLSYRWLLMRTLQSVSGAKYSLKEYSKSIEYCLQALQLAEQIGDANGAFNALDTLTEVYRAINNYPQAMSAISRSQPLLDCCAFNPIKVWRHYGIVAIAFYSAGSYAAAIEFQREALRRALLSNDPDMISLSHTHLGLMYGRLGNYEEALKHARLGHEIAATQASQSRGKGWMAYSSLQLGHLYREIGDCERAIQSYDEAISVYQSLKFSTHLYQAHKGRLVCYIKEKNDSLARQELQTTLTLIDNNRSTILEDDNRNKFFDVEQSIYDLGIDYISGREKDGRGAFAYSEASRARSLADLIVSGNVRNSHHVQGTARVSEPLSLTEIMRGLPVANQIIEYTVLDDKTLIWVINQHDFQVKESQVSRGQLENLVRNYLRSVSEPHSDDVTTQGRKLFELLIQPVESLLDHKQQLNIIPDKVLNLLPFASLVSTTSNKFLIDDYCISYSPSATVLILASGGASKINPGHPEKILSIGNPSFNPDRFRSLPNLKDAEREAKEIWPYYGQGHVLVGPDATKRAVLAEIYGSEVVHLALHSIEEEQAEMHSRLIMAKEAQESGYDDADDVLEAREIYQLRLPNTRLVVLSACQTGVGHYYGGEGTFSLARAFLVSGVPVVVASLWPVESEATADLMINFHRHRKQDRLSTAEALRESQLNMLTADGGRFRHPYYWAAFSVLGGAETAAAIESR
jgi:CHAT domain-containing protein/tetratricopeptide (TPR) repeat protein